MELLVDIEPMRSLLNVGEGCEIFDRRCVDHRFRFFSWVRVEREVERPQEPLCGVPVVFTLANHVCNSAEHSSRSRVETE